MYISNWQYRVTFASEHVMLLSRLVTKRSIGQYRLFPSVRGLGTDELHRQILWRVFYTRNEFPASLVIHKFRSHFGVNCSFKALVFSDHFDG